MFYRLFFLLEKRKLCYHFSMSDGAKHNVDYLIIGGGIAGTTAAETIRNKDDSGTIAIVSKEPHVLYSRVLLPKYVEGALSRAQVFLRTVEDYNKRNISLYLEEEATVLDLKRNEVRTRRGTLFFYKQLLIAAGGHAKPWRVEGSETVPITRFQTINDADALYSKLSEKHKQEVVLVGGGFIALELINALVPRGVSMIHCLISEKRYWQDYMDTEGSVLLETHLERKGVIFHHNELATRVRQDEKGTITVFTGRNTSYAADVLAVGVGLDREVETFRDIGMEVNRGIITNEFLETTTEHIWAAGDVAENYHPVFEQHLLTGNWNNAFLQGRIVGLNMAASHMKTGHRHAFTYVPLYAIDVLGMHIAFLGDVSGAIQHTNRTYISRFQEGAWYERFGMEDGKLVSAVFINKFKDKRVIELLIKEQRDCVSYIPYLSDPSVTLADYIT